MGSFLRLSPAGKTRCEMEHNFDFEALYELLKGRNIRALREKLAGMNVVDTAEFIQELEGEERLIEAVSQLEASRRQLQETRQSVLRLTAAMNAYIQSALSEDAEARMQLEAAMRDMEVTLGLRAMPQDELAGTVDDATILSIDSESGLIVINAGRDAKVMVGMPMLITRGTQQIAEAVVTDVRKKVAGLLVRKHLNPALKIDVGDHASVTSTTY